VPKADKGEVQNGSTRNSESATHAQDVVEACETSASIESEANEARPISAGYIMKNAELLVATPVDYLFLVLPSFADSATKSPSSKGLFLSVDDLLEKLFDGSKHFGWLSSHESVRLAIEERMRVVCDTVDAGDEKMYRLNDELLLKELVFKAKNMVAMGLPASMEETFIRKTLESPVMVIKHEESSVSNTSQSQTGTPISESTPSDLAESQTSTATSSSKDSAASVTTEVTVPDESDPREHDKEICHLLRIRTALSYIISVYLPSTLATKITSTLSSTQTPLNFQPLDSRLATLAKMRAEALAARSLGDFSRKRSMYEDDEAAESRAEKKRRKEEEEKKKKAGESRSIRDLKKVDTKGMRKMSDFFGKGTATKKKG